MMFDDLVASVKNMKNSPLTFYFWVSSEEDMGQAKSHHDGDHTADRLRLRTPPSPDMAYHEFKLQAVKKWSKTSKLQEQQPAFG